MDDSSFYDEVTRQLDGWERRRFWSDAFLWLPRGLLAGLIAAALIAALARWRPILRNGEVALIILGLALLGLILSFVFLLLRKHSPLERARFFDKRFGLRERASTAIEIHAGELATTPSLAEEQAADAARSMAAVDAVRRMPLRPRRLDLLMIVAAGFVLLLAVVLPNSLTSVLDEQQALAESIAEQVAAIEAIVRHIQDDPLLADAGRQELLQPLEAALSELDSGDLSREEAVAVLSSAEADLRELTESNNAESIGRALQQAGQTLVDNPLSQAMGQALANGDLARAGSAANQLADALEQLPANEVSDLARDLAGAAAALQEVDPSLAAEMMAAAQALQSGDVESAQQALRQAAATMQQRALELAAAVQAQAAAEALRSAREQVASAGAAGDSALTAGGGEADAGDSGQGQGGQDSGNGPGAGQSNGALSEDGQGAGGPGPGGGHAESVFAPDAVDLSAESGVEIELPAECVANPENCGALLIERPTEFSDERSLVPYEQVFGDYRNAAYEALEGDHIPLGLKEFVREYFSSLEP